MSNRYDVIIVGGGPAGLFAGLELTNTKELNVLLIEKGEDITKRTNLLSGIGGAGAYSDGKLTLSTETGGRIKEYIGDGDTAQLVKYVDELYLRFGATKQVYGLGEAVDGLRRQAVLAGMRLIPSPIRHLGTDHCRELLKNVRNHLGSRLEIKVNTAVVGINVENDQVTGIETKDGQRIDCRYLILAPGRVGAEWLSDQSRHLGLTLQSNPVDIGVRVEVSAPVLAQLTDVLYEAKLEYLSQSFEDRIRTFCMCPNGEVIQETAGDGDPITTVNGQSYADIKTGNTNFALLVSTNFTEPFHEPIAYAKYIARLANILSGGVLVQRFGDLLSGRRSTPSRIERGLVQPTLTTATPGDLSFVLPYRQLNGIVEMLQAMDIMVPGVASRHTLLYGVEIKLYSSRLKLTPGLETEIANMYCIGDGAGVSRGLIQASGSGIVAAHDIIKRTTTNITDKSE